jgi:biopolymer transport protein ExbD
MRFRRRLVPETNLNLIPLIDVVFQLIVFFMVATTFIITPGISLLLPTSNTAEPVAMTRLVVTVVSKNEIYFNKEKHDLESFALRLSEVTEEERAAIKTVVLEGDRSVPYSLLVGVLDALRRNGFRGINLKTKEP